MKSLKTFYDTLQVPRTATIAALRTAHKALTAQLQPEHHPQDPGAAAQQLLLVNKALEVLIHPDARQAYDAWLNERVGASDVPTLPDLVEPPSPAGASTKVSSEVLEPLPTLDLDGFAAEVAAKAKASASAKAAAPNSPNASAGAPARPPVAAPIANPAAKPTATQPPVAKPAASLSTAPLPAPVFSAPAAAAPKAPSVPSTPSGFAETLPYQPSDLDDLPDLDAPARKAAAAASAQAQPAASVRPVARQPAALRALDWLRERPIALVGAVLACVLLIAFAPWLWRATAGAFRAEVPVAAPLQPTYVEPPAEAVSAPAAYVEPVEAVEDIAEPSTPALAAAEPAPKKAKPRTVSKRVADPKRAAAPVAPAPEPEPVVAPAPVDPGGHSGFAPKCRWVTPTNWSCK